jgi:hypothetical protein
MKTIGVVVILFLAAFAFAPANLNAQGTYFARLISPTVGAVLHPGQKFGLNGSQSFHLET